MSDAKDTTNKNGTAEAVPAPALSADEQMIQDGFNALLNDYLSSNHRRKVERITKAFNFANQAHAGVKRRSGEPYIMHHHAPDSRRPYRLQGDGIGLDIDLRRVAPRRGGGHGIYGRGYPRYVRR